MIQRYRQGGLTDTQVKLYLKGRHELTNETNRQQVFDDLGQWLDQHFSKQYELNQAAGEFAEAGIRSNQPGLQPIPAH